MTRAKYILVSLLKIFFTAGLVQAQELVIYPAKGQSAEQMDKDKYECYTWAKQQAADYQKNRDGYNRSYSACLEGKGYTVK
jgi:hypothetical protein